MFDKKKDSSQIPPVGDENNSDISAPPLKPFSRKGSHAPAKPPAAATFHPEVSRRIAEIPSTSGRRMERPSGPDTDTKRLVIGREICLSGEIISCDKLVVEGRAEVALPNARFIKVAQSGYFKGMANVEAADISGRFEGELVARDRLVVRAGGSINGIIRYGSIVIESGGEISGDMQSIDQTETAGKGSDGGLEDPPKNEPVQTKKKSSSAKK